ncbi:unnamed protein product [Tilletia controversa]|nr:unnamed protein product [Tilletia caries]CAD6962684.1 unnamed protein product [Tilletia controversa]CAD6977019.1 unnamed protein product [Tilletia controversa]
MRVIKGNSSSISSWTSLILVWVFFSCSTVAAYNCTTTYSVVSGDSCDVICRKNNVPASQLQQLNSGLNCAGLQVGQSLCLRAKEYDCGTATYTVASGDTCYSIASAKGISTTQLTNDNPGLNCNAIYVGQVLCVSATTPGTTSTATTTTTTSKAATTTTATATSSATASPSSTAAVVCSNYSTVQAGDTCDKICARSKVSLYNLQQLNTASICSSLQSGAGICVDGSSNNCGGITTVASGQGCSDIATKSNTTVANLRTLNPNINVNCTNIYAGEVLCVKPRPPTPTWYQTCTSQYSVVVGDTCNKIAAKLSLTTTQLLGLNSALSCSALQVGQMLCGFRPSVSVCPQPVFIKSADTCYGLASNVSMSLPEWQSLNTFNNAASPAAHNIVFAPRSGPTSARGTIRANPIVKVILASSYRLARPEELVISTTLPSGGSFLNNPADVVNAPPVLAALVSALASALRQTAGTVNLQTVALQIAPRPRRQTRTLASLSGTQPASISGTDSGGQYCCNSRVQCAPRSNSTSCYVAAGCLFNCLDRVYPAEDTDFFGTASVVVVQQPFGNSTERLPRRDTQQFDKFGRSQPELIDDVIQRSEPPLVGEDHARLLSGMPLSWFQVLDQDADGFVTLDELESILSMNWESPQAAYTARRAFALPEPVELLEALDRDGDDRISREELANLLRARKRTAPEVCSALRLKSETCQSRHLLQCSGYLPAAEAACRNGHDNLIQKCIENHPCDEICSCIRSVEQAALGRADLHSTETSLSIKRELQVVRGGPHRHGIGHHKRLLPALFAAALAALLEIDLAALLVAVGAALYQVQYFYSFRFTSVTFWDPNGGKPPPACSTYLFWSRSCGAIMSEGSHRCDPQGTRVYGHSCWDHFRYGSRGCGFLNLGCKSLCANVNADGCPCSLVNNYDMQADVSYPGTVYSTVDISAPSACADLCNKDTTCVLFEIPPLTADHKSPQCLLKSSADSPVTLTGTTSFVKKSALSSGCKGNIQFSSGKAGDDWFADGSSPVRRRGEADLDSREFLEEEKLRTDLVPVQSRGFGPPGKTTFASPNAILELAALVVFLYSRTQPNMNGDPVFQTLAGSGGDIWPFYRWTNVDNTNRPEVTNTNTGGWNWAEITQRLLNAYRRFVIDAGVLPSIPANPAAGSTAARLIPPSLRSIIAANAGQITGSQTWPYRGVFAGTPTAYANIQIAQAANVGFFQSGGVGPTSLEGAFILALQVAGVNFGAVRSALQAAQRQGNAGGDYTSSMLSGNIGNQFSMCIPAFLRSTGTERTMGQYSCNTADSPRRVPQNGVYFTLDLDPDLAYDPNRNILIFAVHTTDPEARIRLTNNNAAMNNPTFTGRLASGSLPANPGSSGGEVRNLAHAHVGLITQQQLSDFNNNPRPGQDFPRYREIVGFHFYLNPEESATDPRQQYRDQDGSPGGSGS